MPKRTSTPDPQIVQYPDGTYYVRVGDRERSLKTKDFAKATKNKPVALAKLNSSGVLAARLKVKDVWDDYVEFRWLQTAEGSKDQPHTRLRKIISPATFNEIGKYWRTTLRAFFSDIRLDKLDRTKWVEYVEQSTLGDLSNPRKVFTGFLKWCESKSYVRFVPTLPIPRVERRARQVLKAHDIKKLFEYAEGSLLLYISASLFMGMRRKEIMTLRWSDIHFVEGYLVLRSSEVKIRRGRPLPLNSFVRTLLSARFEAQAVAGLKSEFVFPNRNSKRRHADIGGLKTAWNRVVKLCGFKPGYVTPHDLRATYEAYAHKAVEFTDTQREKFAGAAIDLQKKIYVRFDADDVRGLEAVVKVEGLGPILDNKLGKVRGKEDQDKLH